MTKPLAIIVGAGSGLGFALMARFSSEGYQAVGLNRSVQENALNGLDIRQVDLGDGAAVARLTGKIIEQYGVPEVIIHNPAELCIKPFLTTSPADFEHVWRSMVLSAVNVVQALLPSMVQHGRGSVIISGATASLRGGANFAAFASAKFALRGLTQSLAREYQKQGIHIAHVILDGILDTPLSRKQHSIEPERMMNIQDVAEIYLQLVGQKKSTWTFELDLRPNVETF